MMCFNYLTVRASNPEARVMISGSNGGRSTEAAKLSFSRVMLLSFVPFLVTSIPGPDVPLKL